MSQQHRSTLVRHRPVFAWIPVIACLGEALQPFGLAPDTVLEAGDTVAIAESRPLSRRKRWVVARVIAKAPKV